MRASRFLLLLFLVLVARLSSAFVARADGPVRAYRLIVHPANPAMFVDRKFVEDAFLKKATQWPEGVAIRPVDLPQSSPIRRQFTEGVLRRSVEAVRTYWQQRIFAGHELPPLELDTEDSVIQYVLKHDGAIGYIGGATDPQGTKVLELR